MVIGFVISAIIIILHLDIFVIDALQSPNKLIKTIIHIYYHSTSNYIPKFNRISHIFKKNRNSSLINFFPHFFPLIHSFNRKLAIFIELNHFKSRTNHIQCVRSKINKKMKPVNIKINKQNNYTKLCKMNFDYRRSMNNKLNNKFDSLIYMRQDQQYFKLIKNQMQLLKRVINHAEFLFKHIS